jgi:hypothetical protein
MRVALINRNDMLPYQKECLFVYKLRYLYLLKRSYFLCSKKERTVRHNMPPAGIFLSLALSRKAWKWPGERNLRIGTAGLEMCFSDTVADEANGNV